MMVKPNKSSMGEEKKKGRKRRKNFREKEF
jgi:hypothetical protein